MIEYKVGDWSVRSNYTDTDTKPKAINVPNLTYATDYAKVSDDGKNAIIANISGSGVEKIEQIRYGGQDVKSVYNGTSTNPANIHVQTNGRQILVELKENYQAENTKLGEVVSLPCVGRIVIQLPTNSLVKGELVADMFLRTIAAAFETGLSDQARIMHLIRGSLLPAGLV